jgi:hypothetical protein
VQTIADHTKGFIKRVASALLGVVLGVLVGNLPQKLAAKFKEVVKGIRDLVRKLIKALLQKLKKIFGRKGAEGQTDPEGEAPGCVHITVRNSGTPQRPGDRRAGCFVAGTLVHTPHGCRPIETLAIGQRVTTLLPDERQLVGQPQEPALSDSSELRLVQLRMTKASGGECRIVWSCDQETWVSVAELRNGETVKTLAGTTHVENIGKRMEPLAVFNIEVDGDHVYRIGEVGVLVHNASNGLVPRSAIDLP